MVFRPWCAFGVVNNILCLQGPVSLRLCGARPPRVLIVILLSVFLYIGRGGSINFPSIIGTPAHYGGLGLSTIQLNLLMEVVLAKPASAELLTSAFQYLSAYGGYIRMIKCFKDSIFVVIFFVMESKCCGFSVLEFQCGVLRFFCLLTFSRSFKF